MHLFDEDLVPLFPFVEFGLALGDIGLFVDYLFIHAFNMLAQLCLLSRHVEGKFKTVTLLLNDFLFDLCNVCFDFMLLL